MSMMDAVLDLEKGGHLLRVTEEVDPNLEIAEIQRRAYLAGAPALFFERVKGTPFPCVSNVFGTTERCAYIFRHTLETVKRAVKVKADPPAFFGQMLRQFHRQPGAYLKMPFAALSSLPKRISPKRAPVLAHDTKLSQLPAIKSWPDDGGPFITLPQVFSQDPTKTGPMNTNLGMYRVQISGNEYVPDEECGIHYQIHRGIGIHHAAALAAGKPLKVSIFVGGHPAATFAAVMPLPEGLSELMFAGMLSGKRFRYCEHNGFTYAADADFCITGTITMETKPEGPFGDHLGYYSLVHPFPVLKVERVTHRKNAVWPFTVVGRPPQEDTSFGQLIHEITEPMVPTSLPGLRALHAVDEAGVHPLLLAVGSERYVPYGPRVPQELLTQANAVLGFNQCSLAKYLMIVADEDDPNLNINRTGDVLHHLLSRIDLTRDLHFQTRTTMDTLDYSGIGLNEGSKLVLAACGDVRRQLATSLPDLTLPEPYRDMRLAAPGIVMVQGPAFRNYETAPELLAQLTEGLAGRDLDSWPLWVVCDDAEFAARTLANFLWVTFTRSNPSHDCYGVESFNHFKHWGCKGPLVIDARIKPHHAPPLIEDPEVTRRVDDLCRKGKSLHGVLDT